jgi:hypothetical protein
MPRSAARPCLRASPAVPCLQRQDPGVELQAGRVDTPTRFDDERHEVRLVAVRLHLFAVASIAIRALEYRTRECHRVPRHQLSGGQAQQHARPPRSVCEGG